MAMFRGSTSGYGIGSLYDDSSDVIDYGYSYDNGKDYITRFRRLTNLEPFAPYIRSERNRSSGAYGQASFGAGYGNNYDAPSYNTSRYEQPYSHYQERSSYRNPDYNRMNRADNDRNYYASRFFDSERGYGYSSGYWLNDDYDW